jgi:GxxExxY protein
MDMSKYQNELSFRIIGAALEVHKILGPGLLESAYRDCLCRELTIQGIGFAREVAIRVAYKGAIVTAFRADIIVNDCVILELKAISKLEPIHSAQLLSYLKASDLHLGLLMNFNVASLKTGIVRIVNELNPSEFPLPFCISASFAINFAPSRFSWFSWLHFNPGFSSKEGQWAPVAAKTSTEGRFLPLMPKTRQERGKAGSQVMRKCRHFRQLGAALGKALPPDPTVVPSRRACLRPRNSVK